MTSDVGRRTSDDTKATNIAIIGGGIGGLVLAFRLIEAGTPPERITLFEASDRCGGIIRSTRRDGFLIEHGPDSVIRTKPAGVKLFTDLGLGDEIVGTEPESRQALIAKGSHLHPVPEGLYLMAPGRLLPFLGSPLLSWPGKLRAALDLVLPRRPADAPEESLAGFVRRRLGRELFERIAQPMVSGIYTADAEQLSLRATMPQFLDWEREHRSLILAARRRTKASDGASGPRYGLFATLRDGLGGVVRKLEERCAGITWRRACPVQSIARTEASWNVHTADGTTIFARLAVCGPAHLAARLLGPVDADLAADLAAIPYAGAVILNLAFSHGDLALPKAAGFVVPHIEGRATLAATFMSVKYAGRAPDHAHLLRVFLGGSGDAGRLDASDSDLVAAACADLRDLLGLRGNPLWHHVDRWPAAMAQYHLGHSDRLARIRAAEARLLGLALVGNGYEGVGIPDLIAQAETVAGRWSRGAHPR